GAIASAWPATPNARTSSSTGTSVCLKTLWTNDSLRPIRGPPLMLAPPTGQAGSTPLAAEILGCHRRPSMAAPLCVMAWIGLDIGGTKIYGAVVDNEKIRAEAKRSTPAE